MRRIFEIVSGDLERFRQRPRVSLLCAARSPLEVNGELLDVACEFASLGAPIWVYSMPISGATAPVTPAGTLALLWAEVLGHHHGDPDGGARRPHPRLLRTRASSTCAHTTMSLGNLESTLMGAAAVEIGHHLGIPVAQLRPLHRRQALGVQAGYEKGLKVMAAVATGADICSGGFGFLDSSSTFSLRMIPVDAEIAAMATRMARGIEITPETLLADSIARVGIGGDFLREKETRRRVRAGEHFVPRIGSRLPFEQWIAEGRTEADAADDAVRAALAAREERGPHLSDDQRRALAEVCDVTTTQ